MSCEVCVMNTICVDVDEEVTDCERFRLDRTEYYCHSCEHWSADHCGLYSCNCATALGEHRIPTRYQHKGG